MHYSSRFTLRQVLKRNLATDRVLTSRPLKVLDVGGADYNGSYRPMFERVGAHCTSVDISDGAGVDLVMAAPDRIDLESASFDVVVSGQTFEHSGEFWNLFAEMVRLCKPDGLVIVVAPSSGPEHRYPVDCYRFLPDSLQALADAQGIHLVDTFRSPYGPFYDLAGVFRKGAPQLDGADDVFVDQRVWGALDEPAQNASPDELDPSVEKRSGGLPTGDFLSRLHKLLTPRNYLEIGVWRGSSLARARCNAVGVDPFPDVRTKLEPHHHVVEMTSEDFFVSEEVDSLVAPLDLVFIDGLHLIEHTVTDLMWIERLSHAGTVVVIDDVFPNHPIQASRNRQSQAWTGDVWKILDLLRYSRPDLLLMTVDTYPTGCAVVMGLNPEAAEFWSAFDVWISDLMADADPSDRVLGRTGALDPNDHLISKVMERFRLHREHGESPPIEDLRSLVRGAVPRMLAPVN